MKRIKKAIKIIENEKECVRQANTCDRNCAICPLVKSEEDILEAYDYAITVLKHINRNEYIRKDKLIFTIQSLFHTGHGKKKSLDLLIKTIVHDNEVDNL